MTESNDGMESAMIKANRDGPSRMAESIALHRALESEKPEAERICYDPYAMRFVTPEALRAFEESLPKYERFIPGLGNSVIARVRYFDDFVA